MKEKYIYHIVCPWCCHGEILSDRYEKLRVSVICPVCSRKYIANLYDLRGYRPKEEAVTKKREMTERFSCPCPACKGETRTDGRGNVRIFVKCPKKHKDGSGRYYVIDLSTGHTCFSSPVKKRRKGGV